MKFQFTKPNPKEKYAICVDDKKPLFFFVSSIPRTRFLRDTQLEVSPADLPFLNRISYVNTAEAITCVVPHTCKVLKDFGPVSTRIKEQIRHMVRESETLPARFVEIIWNNLR